MRNFYNGSAIESCGHIEYTPHAMAKKALFNTRRSLIGRMSQDAARMAAIRYHGVSVLIVAVATVAGAVVGIMV